MNIDIGLENGNVLVGANTVASPKFDLARVRAAFKLLSPHIVIKKKSSYFQIENNFVWEGLLSNSVVVEVCGEECHGCVINLCSIESRSDPEQCFALMALKFNMTLDPDITTSISRKYSYNWGSLNFMYDLHYGAASIELKYQSR